MNPQKELLWGLWVKAATNLLLQGWVLQSLKVQGLGFTRYPLSSCFTIEGFGRRVKDAA